MTMVCPVIEAAPGPIEVAADWPDLEAWEQYPAGGAGRPGGDVLAGHVDHSRVASGIDVRKAHVLTIR